MSFCCRSIISQVCSIIFKEQPTLIIIAIDVSPLIDASVSLTLATADPRVERRGFRCTAVLTSEETVLEHVGKAAAVKPNADENL